MSREHEHRAAQRISCACLCEIRDTHGRYLLALNANRLAQGRQVYTPLGGALQYDVDVLALFRGQQEDEGTHDLRLMIDPARLGDFRAWFLSREGRETSAFRELHEELVEEFGVFQTLTPKDVTITYARTFETFRVTDRSGVSGVPTHYFHEIYAVRFLQAHHRTRLAALPIESGLAWFTADEIIAGTAAGRVIDGKALLMSG